MKQLKFVVTILSLLGPVLPAAFAAAPANDNFANRIVLPGAVITTFGNSAEATGEAGEPAHWTSSGGKSVWWSWTAPNSVPTTITTSGSDFDTVLSIYTGSVLASLNRVTNNDDYLGGQSGVIFNAVAGTTYQIAVDGFSSASGNVQLNITNVMSRQLVNFKSPWRYLDDGVDPGIAWREAVYNDAGWSNGVAEFGFGDNDESTIVRRVIGGQTNVTFYFRKSFTVANATSYTNASLRVIRDDGVVVYLNGSEVLRNNLPGGPITHASLALSAIGGSDETTPISGSVNPALLVDGNNVLAVEMHQNTNTSSDVSFDLEFSGIRNVANQIPFVSLTGPANGTSFDAPANISLTAEAGDNDGPITRVEFFQNGNLIGNDTSHPYSQAWNTVGPGTYQLAAVAVDSAGARATSVVVNVTVTASSNPTNVLVEFGSPWKFLDDGSNQGTAWQAANFNDGGWPVGLAQLGYDTSVPAENDEATVVGYGSDPQNKYVTTYFRRAFTVNNVANITNLTLTLLRDDGGVVYLNGSEIYRSPNMTGVFAYDGLATATGDNTIDVTNVTSHVGSLVNGTNVLAVEIHQQARSSSDMSFDLRLVGVRSSGSPNIAPQVAITSPANSAQFGVGAAVNYQVTAADADGSIARVELFRNGVKVGEDSSSPFSISFANPSEGTARFVAAATDNGGALALSTPISITFTSAAPGSLIPVGAVWRFLDDGTDQGVAWTLPGFDDSSWGAGPAQLGYGDGDEATVVRSSGAEGRIITTYFRHAFFVADPSAFTYLTVRLRRDDGAIVYLNGREAFRSNMLPGPVSYQTLAQNAGDDGATWFSNNAPATLLTPGVNYVAVEVHQSDPGSSDISFDLELQGNTGPFNNNPPFVAIGSPGDGSVFTEPANIVINPTATDSDGGIDKVEFFSNGVKLGEDNSSPFSYTISAAPIGTYALRAIATDFFGAAATSAVVTVSVVPSTAPELVSRTPTPGNVTDLTQITVQFSEPVDGVNASDLLINSVPATAVSGSGTTYTFSFSRPLEGVVTVSFASNSGITDRESPPKPFDSSAAAATWQYTLSDTVAPTVVAIEPVPGATVPSLNEVEVTFSEPVGGVNASDLRVNNVPATSVSGSGDGPYVFSFVQPVNGTVQLVWTNNHGIRDVSAAQNAFAGGSWSYTLNTAVAETNVVISEIMYHPSSELPAEEYIELYNKGATAINLNGWQFSRGVSFVFPNVTIAPNGYLVVAANVAAFNAKYPGVANVVGGWTGRLSNSDEEIELENALGDAIDSVTYADEGDWALRRVSAVFPPGLDWLAEHDGLGKSLELINLRMPNQYGQNWAASITAQGTPGRTNSVLATNIAPMVLNVAHFPAVPKSTNTVTITARLVDELTTGLSATLFWRLDSGAFSSVPMADNGLNGDGLAGDGTYGVILPAQTNRAIVEFYVSATDSGNRTRTWPAPTDGSGTQGANALYQVDDSTYSGSQPMYRLILTRADDAALRALNSSNPQSDVEFNTSFVSSDGVDTKIRYNASVRHRGQGSRGANPPNLRLRFPRDQRWNDVSAINLNSQYTHSQLAGSVISRRAGLDSEHAIVIQLRRNGVNDANSGLPQLGSYVHMESRDSDWVENHYPDEANGNLYTCTRNGTDLSYRGIDPQTYINNGYLKDSNGSENDYSDIAALTSALQLTPDAQYAATVRQWVNVDQWMRYLAVMTLIGYGETSIGSDGQPDDYTLFSGENDRRFLIFPHDHDTDMGQGDGSALAPNMSIFRATTGNSQINRFMKWPEFVPIYYAELVHQLNTTFAAPVTEDLLDAYLGSWVPAQRVSDMKNWIIQRRVSVLSQIPLALTINTPSLTQQNGYYRTTASSVTLNGLANVIETRFVKVNGQFANWTAWQGTWSSTVSLSPGINRVVVQTTDAQGAVLKEATIDIWYDDGSIQSVSGAISGGQTWTAANGPYQLTASVTIGNGATLTIQPGTTVFLNSGVNITVSGSGRLLAEGTAGQRIRFTRLPSASGTWGQIFLNGASQESRIAYADIEYAGASGGVVRADNSVLYMDHVVFGNTAVQYVNVNNSSFAVRHSVFPTSSGIELFHGIGVPASGYAIIEGNWFGSTTGLNDIIDFSGGQRPNAILQILGNTFSGASDDVLDLDGTDAHIEGNIFMNVHQATAGGDTSSAISGGVDGGNTSEITIVRNLFYDVDHVALAKEGNFYTLINNTAVKVGVSAVNFSEPLRSTAGGAGALLDGNIISDCPLLFENYTSAVMNVTVNRSMLPSNWAGAGTGNLTLDPMLANTNTVTAQTIVSAFSLLPGSPAIGSGPNGLDRGALVAAGASISGEPASPTALNSATLTVGGPGITHYRYRLNNGSYGAETPVGTPISLGGLSSGTYQVFVIGRNSAGVYQDVAAATASRPWVVNASVPVVRLNEVLARNVAAVPVGSRFPDLIELYNPGSSVISLAGIGVSDDADQPFRYVFPAGASINPGQYLILYADSEVTPAGFHLGFGLGQDGDAVHLTASNGRRMDSVRFGMQIADFSIGRSADGSWSLNQPTLGAANVVARTGNPRQLKINEWLANGLTPFPDDFIELFNPNPLPVSLGELYLTDNPIGAPLLHDIEPLSFIAGGGFALFIASGDDDQGANHLNFKLSPEQGMIGLMAANGSVIDCVIYGPQTTDVSMGRQPNGSSTFAFFTSPTPGAPNPGIVIPNQTLVINEVLAYNINKLDTDGTTPDWVELYNPSASTVNIGDMSLTDDLLTPRRYVFAAGTTIPANGFLAIRCDGDKVAGVGNTGFGLKQTGGGVYLFDKLANGGSQLSAVNFGVQAADFSIGRVPNGGTNWMLTLESIGTANIAASLADAGSLKVNEWMADPGPGLDDWFELYNPNAQPVALGGLYLSDDLLTPAGRRKHLIAPLSFIGSGGYAYQQFFAAGASQIGRGPDFVAFGLSKDADAIGISTPAGNLIDSITFGVQTEKVSQGRLPDGGTVIASFPKTASPTEANYLLLTNVVISEALTHTDLPMEDAIELQNISAGAVNVSGWYLSDAKRDPKKFRIPNGTTMAAGGFKVFYEYQFNDSNSPAFFSLSSAKGDEIYLSQVNAGGELTGYRSEVSFGAAANGVSFGRYVTSVGTDFTAMTARTFGADNPATVAQFRLGTGLLNAAPVIGPIVISEIMYHPPDIGAEDNVIDEFVELRNITGASVALFDAQFPSNTWKLKDGITFSFPQGTTIPANGVVVVVSFDPANATQLAAFRAKYGMQAGAAVYGPYNGKLDNGGESVELARPDVPQVGGPDNGLVPFILVDKVKYADTAPWPTTPDGLGHSLQRAELAEYGNDPVNWLAATPTPGPQGGSPDGDGDGMDDAWEQTYFGNLSRNGSGDFDNDGMTDLNEFLAGTLPNNASSALRLTVTDTTPTVLTFSAAANKAYVIEFKNTLGAASWSQLQTVPAGAARTVNVTDAQSTATRFYRLRLQ